MPAFSISLALALFIPPLWALPTRGPKYEHTYTEERLPSNRDAAIKWLLDNKAPIDPWGNLKPPVDPNTSPREKDGSMHRPYDLDDSRNHFENFETEVSIAPLKKPRVVP
ncbi:hypothetical protein FRB93_013740 [Tulasnella sp. JGI-2019a]|nr:hypothetical protein FRB93_013740 [Tulasnella sp. JGI-2019a]